MVISFFACVKFPDTSSQSLHGATVVAVLVTRSRILDRQFAPRSLLLRLYASHLFLIQPTNPLVDIPVFVNASDLLLIGPTNPFVDVAVCVDASDLFFVYPARAIEDSPLGVDVADLLFVQPIRSLHNVARVIDASDFVFVEPVCSSVELTFADREAHYAGL